MPRCMQIMDQWLMLHFRYAASDVKFLLQGYTLDLRLIWYLESKQLEGLFFVQLLQLLFYTSLHVYSTHILKLCSLSNKCEHDYQQIQSEWFAELLKQSSIWACVQAITTSPLSCHTPLKFLNLHCTYSRWISLSFEYYYTDYKKWHTGQVGSVYTHTK